MKYTAKLKSLPNQLIIASTLMFLSFTTAHAKTPYTGEAYKDNQYHKGIQAIPGKIQFEYFDLGGAGIAYSDTDKKNQGSGNLNPANGDYLNEFRIAEGVDISYTKEKIDTESLNMVKQTSEQLYIGWTEVGEWTKYTVDVKKPGKYAVGFMYTSNGIGGISLSVNDKELAGTIDIPSTHQPKEKLDWMQWHHWNKIDSIVEVEFYAGIQQLTITTTKNGNMNLDYLEFRYLGDIPKAEEK